MSLFALAPSQPLEMVPIYTANRPSHGIIPTELVDKVKTYYESKGHSHIADDLQRQVGQFDHTRLQRPVRAATRQAPTLLADGQVVKVYTAKNTEKLRLREMRSSSTPSADKSVNEAYDGSKATYDFLKKRYGWKSVDNHKMPLYSTVHYDRNYCNAFWDGDEMVYGDGDGKFFNRFTKSIDVTGHEIGHGLTQERCGIAVSKDGRPTGVDYEQEAGGINEALSDILGIQIKQNALNLTSAASDWLIGSEIIAEYKGRKYALRSMADPGKGFVNHPYLGTDSQVATYPDYLARREQGEVDPHDSSGIPNKAFWHASIKLGGYSWEKAGRIFFETMPLIKFDETFAGLAEKTIGTAGRIFGRGSPEEGAIIEGWKVAQVIL